jgi:hypothetical protein
MMFSAFDLDAFPFSSSVSIYFILFELRSSYVLFYFEFQSTFKRTRERGHNDSQRDRRKRREARMQWGKREIAL